MADKTPKRPKARQAAAAAESGAELFRPMGREEIREVFFSTAPERKARRERHDALSESQRRLISKNYFYFDYPAWAADMQDHGMTNSELMARLPEIHEKVASGEGVLKEPSRRKPHRFDDQIIMNYMGIPGTRGVISSKQPVTTHYKRALYEPATVPAIREHLARMSAEARKAAAKRPHNPRMGQTKRKYGGY